MKKPIFYISTILILLLGRASCFANCAPIMQGTVIQSQLTTNLPLRDRSPFYDKLGNPLVTLSLGNQINNVPPKTKMLVLSSVTRKLTVSGCQVWVKGVFLDENNFFSFDNIGWAAFRNGDHTNFQIDGRASINQVIEITPPPSTGG